MSTFWIVQAGIGAAAIVVYSRDDTMVTVFKTHIGGVDLGRGNQRLIEKVPARKLITTNLLCQKLTQQFNVRGTCPVTTQKALQAVAHDAAGNGPAASVSFRIR